MSVFDLIGLSLALVVFRAFESHLSTNGSGRWSSGRTITRFAVLPTALLLAGGLAPRSAFFEFYQYLIFPVVLVLTWKIVTRNYDHRRQGEPARVLLIGLGVTSGLSDVVLPAFLCCLVGFNPWTHHFLLPIRLVMAYTACRLAGVALGLFAHALGTPPAADAAWPLYLLMAVHLSHYVVPGVAKLTLGAKPWSWIVSNQTHLLLPAAYAWGWRRVWPERHVWLAGRALSRLTPGMNAAAVALECGCLIALISPDAYAAVCAAILLFHLVIFLLSGICFWEYAVVNVLFGLYFLLWFETAGTGVFGLKAVLIVGGLILLFPLRRAVWKPHRLAWWETPLLSRIRLEVIGRSGSRYGLYNDFMCPHDREFGRIPLRYCIDEPVLTGHLGQVEDEHLRDLIVATRGNPDALRDLKHAHGERLYDARAVERFAAEMKALLGAAQGAWRRSPLPHRLRALKAPGGHYYYWGDQPPYSGQEEARALRVYYAEEYLFQEARVTLSERMICEIDLSALEEGPPRR